MQSIQTSHLFSLESVKPLEKLKAYRAFCLEMTKKMTASSKNKRTHSFIKNSSLVPWHTIDGLKYLQCSKTGSLFLEEVPNVEGWTQLLKTVNDYRRSPEAFHTDITASRVQNVLEPKRQWIENALLLSGFKKAKVLEVGLFPSPFTPVLKNSKAIGEVIAMDETQFSDPAETETFDAAILLETLDRALDPVLLLEHVFKKLKKGGILFATALVASGFDFQMLQDKNCYLYPPDRMNCFTLQGLQELIQQGGWKLLEVSTPGVLDVEVVKSHQKEGIEISLSPFEKKILEGDADVAQAFQVFLQQANLSSFARIVGEKK